MNDNSLIPGALGVNDPRRSPILLVPYMWIGDFVRCHSVVRLLRARFPERPIDMLATTLCAPLTDYMPGVRRAVVVDLPRKRLAFSRHRELATRLRAEAYGSSLVMPKTWKSALAPFLAGIPERTGLFGEARFIVLNDLRFARNRLPRMVDECASLALPSGTALPPNWPAPELRVPAGEVATWRARHGLGEVPAVALAPGAVNPSKRWPAAAYAALRERLLAQGLEVWVLGGPAEKSLARDIVGDSPARDLTGTDLREAILALAAASAAVSNDSGLLHVAAAIGTPAVAIFGPTSPWHWAPLNPLAAALQADADLPCRPCHKPVCRLGHHRCMTEIGPEQVFLATLGALNSPAAATR